MLSAGDTFLSPKTADAKEHLFFVLSDPDAMNKSLCVNITSLQSFHDQTVVLKAGDHPFVRHDSAVLYVDIDERDMYALDKLMAMKSPKFVCQPHKQCSVQLLQRLRQGVIDSPDVEKIVKKKYAAIWGIAYV